MTEEIWTDDVYRDETGWLVYSLAFDEDTEAKRFCNVMACIAKRDNRPVSARGGHSELWNSGFSFAPVCHSSSCERLLDGRVVAEYKGTIL